MIALFRQPLVWQHVCPIVVTKRLQTITNSMNVTSYRISLLFLTATFSFLTSTAQNDDLSRVASNWFQEERFLMADQNDDAKLNAAEMQAFENEFVFFLDARQYDWTDKNNDGLLSFTEIKTVEESEINYRFQAERRDLQTLSRSYPLLNQADKQYLKNNPDLVTALFSNFKWLMENETLAQDILDDQLWIAQNPEAMVALHKNLRWMVANPENARKIYRDRSVTQQLPEFLAWRADHQDLIRRYPRVGTIYNLDFIHAGIRIRR